MSLTPTHSDFDAANLPELQLSVIVPVRNEALSLAECLESLVGQSDVGFALGAQWELIVVDDDSSDGSRAIAERFAGVKVMEAPPLDLSERGGYTGKNNACWAGAQIARGRRFLFTDADTVHQPGDLTRAMREMEKHEAVMLSYSPRQIVTGFWQYAVMPLIFSELATVYPPKVVSDPARKLAVANGQFLMVDREDYFAVGGHRAVGRSVLEDVALAQNIKRSSRVIRFRYAPDALAARMYRTTGEMIEGWTKNLALLLPKPVWLAMWRVLDVLLYFGLPGLALGLVWLQPWQRYCILLLWLRTLWRFYERVQRSSFPAWSVAISILGVPLFVYLLIRSAVHRRIKKSVMWKGRSYNPNR